MNIDFFNNYCLSEFNKILTNYPDNKKLQTILYYILLTCAGDIIPKKARQHNKSESIIETFLNTFSNEYNTVDNIYSIFCNCW